MSLSEGIRLLLSKEDLKGHFWVIYDVLTCGLKGRHKEREINTIRALVVVPPTLFEEHP